MQVLHLLCIGKTNKEIGRELYLTENTVKFHVRNIYSKLTVTTRAGAVTAARQAGLVP
jgi:LuxR family maltose regulon positive regulatory protein